LFGNIIKWQCYDFFSFFLSFHWFSHMFLASEAVGWGIWSTAGRGYRYSKTCVHVTHSLLAWLCCVITTPFWNNEPFCLHLHQACLIQHSTTSYKQCAHNRVILSPPMSVLPLNVFVFRLFPFDLSLPRHGGGCYRLCTLHYGGQFSTRMDFREGCCLRLMQVFQLLDHSYMYSSIWCYIFFKEFDARRTGLVTVNSVFCIHLWEAVSQLPQLPSLSSLMFIWSFNVNSGTCDTIQCYSCILFVVQSAAVSANLPANMGHVTCQCPLIQ
jgi:hypothetical protein